MAATVNRRPPCLAFAGIVVALLIVHELVLEQNLMTLGQVVQQDEATDAAPALQRQQVGQTDGDAKILTLQAEQIKLLEEQIAILRRAYSGSSGSPPAASKTPSPPAAPTHAPTPVPAGGAEPPTPPMPPPTPPTVMAPPPSSASQPAGADAPTAGPPDTPPATQNLANNKATPHWKNTLLLIAFNCAPCDTYRAPGTIARLASLYGQDFQNIVFYGPPAAAACQSDLAGCVLDEVPPGQTYIGTVSNRNAHGQQCNHKFLLDAFDRFPGYNGYFMIADDLMISEGAFREYDQAKIWVHSYPRALWNPAEPHPLSSLTADRWGPVINRWKSMPQKWRQNVDRRMRGGMAWNVMTIAGTKSPKKPLCRQPLDHDNTTCFDYDWLPLAGQGGDLGYIPASQIQAMKEFCALGVTEMYIEHIFVWMLIALSDEPPEFSRGIIVPSAMYGKRTWRKHYRPEQHYFHPVAQHGKRQPSRGEPMFDVARDWPKIAAVYNKARGTTPQLLPKECLGCDTEFKMNKQCMQDKGVSPDQLKGLNGFGTMGGPAKVAPFSICSGDRFAVVTKGEVVNMTPDSLAVKLSFSSPGTVYVWVRPGAPRTVAATDVTTHGERLVVVGQATVSAHGPEQEWHVYIVSVDTNDNRSPVELAMVVKK